MKLTSTLRFLARLALLAGLPVLVHAQTWSNPNGSDWNVGANWDIGTVPTSAQIATIGIAVNGSVITNANAEMAILGLYYTNSGGNSLTLQATGAGSFLIGSSGSIRNNNITVPGAFTIDAPIVAAGNLLLYANQVSGGTFTISGGISSANANPTTLTLRGSNNQGANNVISGLISDGSAGGVLSVTKLTTGGSSWTLSNSGNTFSGPVTIGSGNIYAPSVGTTGNASALGSNGTINMGVTTSGGTFIYSGVGETSDKSINLSGTTGGATIYSSGTGGLNFTGNVTATGAGVKTLTLRGNGNVSYVNSISGAIVDSSGATSLTKADGDIWSLSGANTYTGTTSVNSGTLVIAKQQALYNNTTSNWTTAKINVNANATFAVGVGDAASGYFDAAALATLLDGSHLGASTTTAGFKTSANLGFDTTNATGGTFTYGSVLANIGSSSTNGFAKLGTGTLVLTQANTYSGATTVNAGKLTIGSAGTINSTSGIAIGAGEFNYNSATALSPTISFSTTGGTLSGTGTITPSVTIAAGNTLAPGNSPGVITFTNDLTLAGTTAMQIDGPVRGTGYDGINVGGTLTYGGSLNLTFGSAVSGSQSYSLFTNLSGTSAPNTIVASFSSINLYGSGYTGTLTNASGVWSASGVNGANFSFSQASGILSVIAVPEPSTYAVIAGLVGLGCAAIRRRRA